MKQESVAMKSIWPIAAIVGVSIFGGYWLAVSGPKTAPEESVRPPKMVFTVEVKPSDHPVNVRAHGIVTPVKEVEIAPEVTGLIIRHHPSLRPGGVLMEGEELFAIDPTIMELNAQEATAAVRRAEVTLEESRRKEAEATQLSNERVIARTDLAALVADVKIQEAELARLRATLDRFQALLDRHVVRAPFNAVVLNESVEVGQRVNPGFAAVTLVGTDQFWVNTALPVNQLQWIQLPTREHRGADATIYFDTGEENEAMWKGRVVQLLSDMENEGRMARVLIQIDNPLWKESATSSIPLLIGSYVRVEIDAGILPNVLAIDRKALRDGDHVWIADSKSQLQIRKAQVRWRSDDTVYISDTLSDGESLITSPLRAALPGMKLKVRSVVDDTVVQPTIAKDAP